MRNAALPIERILEGSGGSMKGGSGKAAKEASDTLRSNAIARIAELICEGEIEGIVGGPQGVYFDQTPLMNADGTLNFTGVEFEQRVGTPDQDHVPGLVQVETPYDVSVEVKQATGPVTRTIVDQGADAVRVIINIPALVQYTDKGDINGTHLVYGIDVRPSGGSWGRAVHKTLVNEKTTSGVQIDHVIELRGTGPWDLRVVREWPDSTSSKLSNSLIWGAYSVIQRGKFTYPYSAYAYLVINAEQFGSSIPARNYKVRGLKIQVPTNYDPYTRTYSGMWDGRFKIAWTNNPAWIFYDLLTNNRYGLGEFIDAQRIDKWSLYQIGRYCDEVVPSGFKNQQGGDLHEHRFTFNGVINTRTEAYTVLKNITNTFRGMAFWAVGQVYAVADMPTDPKMTVAPANVIEGRFSYSGTSRKSRHSVAQVSWNDPADFGKSAVEAVINDEALRKFGWRETRVQAHGCTSRGQAHRYGKWILDTELHETETVAFSAGWDMADLKPFEIINVHDPAKMSARTAGRIVEISANLRTVTLDAAFEPENQFAYHLSVAMPSGVMESVKIQSWSNDGRTVVLERALSAQPVDQTIYGLFSSYLNPRPFRVLTIKENDGIFQVTALLHDPTKYARVERDILLDPINYTRPPSTTEAPIAAEAVETQFLENGTPVSRILLSWTPGSPLAVRHMVEVAGPRGRATFNNIEVPYQEIENVVAGRYTFKITSFGITGIPSKPFTYEYDAKGWGEAAMPQVIDLHMPGGPVFNRPDAEIAWTNVLAAPQFYLRNTVQVWDAETSTLLRSEVVQGERYVYTLERNRIDNRAQGRSPARKLRFVVTLQDTLERTSPEASLAVENPVPDTPAPEVYPGVNQIFLNWTNPADLDFAGTLVWVTETPNFDPEVEAPVVDTTSSILSYPIYSGRTQYIRIACYDTFGKTGLKFSPQFQVTPLVSDVDVDPPIRPTGFKGESTLTEDGRARILFTWDENTEDTDLAGFQISIREVLSDGTRSNYVPYPVSDNQFEFVTIPGLRVEAILRAYDRRFNYSVATDPIIVDAARDLVAPDAPTGLIVRPTIKALWLTWAPNEERDVSHYEVYVGETLDVLPNAIVKDSASTSFIYYPEGATTKETYYMRVRAVDVSGNASDWSGAVSASTLDTSSIIDDLEFDLESLNGQIDGTQIDNLSISTPHLRTNAVDARHIRAFAIRAVHLATEELITNRAQIGDAVIDSAHIIELDAAKLRAGTALAGSIVVGNQTLAQIQANSQADPVDRINRGATFIDPGKIRIKGASTLTSWIMGGDSTEINGGAIAANTVKTNSLEVGQRGIAIEGVEFEHNKPSLNYVSWTAGTIRYITDEGMLASVSIPAGQAQYTGQPLYLVYIAGTAGVSFSTSVAYSVSGGAQSCITLACYRGNLDLVTNWGRTVIDGSKIKTGTVDTDQLAARSVKANNIDVGAVNAGHIQSRQITSDKAAIGFLLAEHIKAKQVNAEHINVGSLSAISANIGDITAGVARSANGKFRIEFDNARILVWDENNVLRVRLGFLG
ncbi:TipJ family phage tail tip protein [Aureimonas sp. AU40]|uniref:TipJ family phage tail tip protein n=1 Tax=Aureimonas sp. AU40 TaxID=1637747 RepID=UPI0007842459|nr:phage tail protein [Aureimonas sp. AU40]